MKILIVDDEPNLLTFLEGLLLGCGLDVKACLSGFEAADALESWRPDVLISDLGLADMRGEDLALAAAHLPRPAQVILMSGDPERLALARPLASLVLEKPFRPLDLVTAVGHLGANR